MRPEDYVPLYDEYIPSLRQQEVLESEVRSLRRQLSGLSVFFSWKSTRMRRRKRLDAKEEALAEVSSSRSRLDQRVSGYSSVKRYVLTDQGVYVSLKAGVRRYVDVNFQPMQIRSSGNFLRGRLAFVFPKDGNEWVEKGLHMPSDFGDRACLEMNIPYNQLTEVDIDRDDMTNKIAHVVTPGRNNIDCFVEKRGPVGGGHLDFPDRRYWVLTHPTSAKIDIDQTSKVGITTVLDYVSDGSPQGYHTENRQTDLYERVVSGEFGFDLTFDRVNSKGQSFR